MVAIVKRAVAPSPSTQGIESDSHFIEADTGVYGHGTTHHIDACSLAANLN